MCGLLVLGLVTGCGNSNSENNGNNGTNMPNVDLTIDETIPKEVICKVSDNDTEYTTDITYDAVLPNWDRYTFLNDAYSSIYSHSKCRDELAIQPSRFYADTLFLEVKYLVDSRHSSKNLSLKDDLKKTVLYSWANEPTIYGNDEIGYWYAYMSDVLDSTDDNPYLIVDIYKQLNTTEWRGIPIKNSMKIELHMDYETDEDKSRLNYLLNEVKELLKENYNIDLSELNVDMIKK